MSDFRYYNVAYVIGADEGQATFTTACMTVAGETTTDDFPKMIGARMWGDAERGEREITVTDYTETEKA